jgi:LuxR family maltose regulon positive regulatory protein
MMKLPRSVLFPHPRTALSSALYLLDANRLPEAELLLEEIEQRETGVNASTADSFASPPDAISGPRLLAARSIIAAASFGDPEHASDMVQRVLEQLAPQDDLCRAMVLTSWGQNHHYRDDLASARQLLAGAVEHSQRADRPNVHLLAVGAHALLLCDLGNLGEALEAMNTWCLPPPLALQDQPAMMATYLVAARIAYLRHELSEADAGCHRVVELAQQVSDPRTEYFGLLLLSDALAAAKRLAEATVALNRASPLAGEATAYGRWPAGWLELAIEARRAGLEAVGGGKSVLSRWAEGEIGIRTEGLPVAPWITRPILLMPVRAHLLAGNARQALALLPPLIARAEAAGARDAHLEMLILSSLALDALGGHVSAREAVAGALAIGEPEGYRTPFLAEGEPMARLLGSLLQEGFLTRRSREYALSLLSPAPDAHVRLNPAAVNQSPLAEPLSHRELEILDLIAQGFTNQEIADRLIIEISTVKWHITSLHGKLGVKRRTQALARARQLGLLP